MAWAVLSASTASAAGRATRTGVPSVAPQARFSPEALGPSAPSPSSQPCLQARPPSSDGGDASVSGKGTRLAPPCSLGLFLPGSCGLSAWRAVERAASEGRAQAGVLCAPGLGPCGQKRRRQVPTQPSGSPRPPSLGRVRGLSLLTLSLFVCPGAGGWLCPALTSLLP